MRTIAEATLWPMLTKKFASLPPEVIFAEGVSIDLATPCTVLGGRNGAGKSRLLRSLASELGARALHLDLPALCEQILIVSRELDDIEDLKEAVGALPITKSTREDLERVIGRTYENLTWYGLDLVPGDDAIANNFTWWSDQTIVPHFEAEYRTTVYTASSMGLGELSVHLLFWVLQQYEHIDDLVILLDEPDAYLPPSAAAGLLARLLNICKSRANRGWRLVMSTHSADIISDAVSQRAFIFLDVNDNGTINATHCADDPTVSDVLLARPAVKRAIFVEDESALHLASALLSKMGRDVAGATSVIWVKGSGNMKALGDYLPRTPRADLEFGFVFDGDQRNNTAIPENADNRWPALFLPSDEDPDTLLMNVRNFEALGARVGQSAQVVSRSIRATEGQDPHDRVNDFADRFGRGVALSALSNQWVEENSWDAAEFYSEMKNSFRSL